MAHRRSGHHRTRRFKVSLVFDHVGDTDTRKQAIRSPNVHRKQNESAKSAQPPIAITLALTEVRTDDQPLMKTLLSTPVQRMVIRPYHAAARNSASDAHRTASNASGCESTICETQATKSARRSGRRRRRNQNIPVCGVNWTAH